MIAPVAAEDSTALLRQELEAMRADYEKRIKDLETRIIELEQAPSPAPPPTQPGRSGLHQDTSAKSGLRSESSGPSPRVPTNESALPANERAQQISALERLRAEASAEFQDNTEIRQMTRNPDAERQLADRVEDILEGYLDITGYFRAGYGRSSEDGSQVGFGLPGVSKYRLGNEAENYGELAFSKTFFRAGAFGAEGASAFDGPVAQTNVRFSFFNPYDNYGSASDTDVSVPEVWASVGNVIASAPEVKFWAGSRFYRRHDIHVNDFFFWDMSGGGGGVEDIPFGCGQLAFAWIGDGAESAVYQQIGQPDPANVAGFSKTNFDLRWYDWPLLGGNGELGVVYSKTESGEDVNGINAPDSDGFALHIVRTKQAPDGGEGLHKTSLQIGNGPAKTFNSVFETFDTATGTFIRPDPNESWRFRATDQLVTRPIEQLSLGTSLVYQYTDYGDGAPDQHWLSGGIRPIWHFNDSFSFAVEGGVDWISESPNGRGGSLGKITFAPQLSFGDKFYSRPVIRAFLTLAAWSDGMQGQVGGLDYVNDKAGATWGLQMESWW